MKNTEDLLATGKIATTIEDIDMYADDLGRTSSGESEGSRR